MFFKVPKNVPRKILYPSINAICNCNKIKSQKLELIKIHELGAEASRENL